MKCSYTLCGDPIKIPQLCKACNKVKYCSTNCRVQDFYKSHNKVCTGRAAKPSPDVSVTQASSKSGLLAYEITSKILGSGSYGEVKLIKHEKTGELCALKTISKQFLQDEKISLDTVLREISIQTSLSHPNIIKLKESCSDQNSIYLILEYAENGSLYEKIRDQGKLDEATAKRIHSQAIQAVSYLHRNSIVHRDIKPENVLIDRKGNVKLCDFGWGVKVEELRNTLCGTLDYMPPEMVKGLKHSYEVDVWALGVLLYEMLHGCAPFKGAKESEKCFNIVNGIYECDESVSEEAQDLIAKMVKIEPAERISLEKALNHQFFRDTENVAVGESFRYYLKNYGMDEGVVEKVGKDCVVRFKNSGQTVKLEKSEVIRRIRKQKLAKVKSESFENEGKIEKEVKSSEKKKFFMLEGLSNSFLSANHSINNSPSSSFSKQMSFTHSLASGKSEKFPGNTETQPEKPGLIQLYETNSKLDDSIFSNLTEKLAKLVESQGAIEGSSTGKSILSEIKSENQESFLNDSGSRASHEESIYHNIGKWIKTPARKKHQKSKKSEKETEKNKSIEKNQKSKKVENETKKDRSLDKQLDRFKGKFIESASESLVQTPCLSPSYGVISGRTLQVLKESGEQEENKGKDESGLMQKIRENLQRQKNDVYNPFPEEKKGKVAIKPFKIMVESSPDGEDEKEMNSPDEVNLEKGCRVFDECEKASMISAKSSRNEEILSPKPNIGGKNVFFKIPEKKDKKNENYEAIREKIEKMHEEFYQELDENLITEKKSVIKAKDDDDDQSVDMPKRTFTEYDKVLKGYPSVVSNLESSDQGVEKSNLKLKGQKKSLEELILNMDKVQKVPIRRPKKQNSIFGWFGKLMGCNERY